METGATCWAYYRRGTNSNRSCPGAALLARSLVADDLAAGRMVALSVRDPPAFTWCSALVCLSREDPQLSSAYRAFVRILREEGRVYAQ